jgi:FkbM family methyltransferase
MFLKFPDLSFIERVLLNLTRNASLPLTIRKKLLRHRKLREGIEFQIDLFETTYYGTTGNLIDDKVFLYRFHEAATIRLMRKIMNHHKKMKTPAVLIDVGTNTGLHLLSCAALADACYGFEPWEPVRNKAVENVLRNNLSRVRIFDFGLSDMDAELPFFPPSNNNFGAGTFVADDAKVSSPRLRLRVRRGDEVMEAEGIAPSLIKIDTEGFDHRVLKGLSQTIERHRPAIIIEMSTETRREFPDERALGEAFPKGYAFFGILRSREFPRLVPYSPRKKFENLLAWPSELSLPNPDKGFSGCGLETIAGLKVALSLNGLIW